MLRCIRMTVLALSLVGLWTVLPSYPVQAQPPSGAMAPGMPAAPKARDSASRSTAAVPNAGLVDINTATAAELQALPGISDGDSAKIIHGRPYADTNQLVSRHVVSEATYDKIKDHVVVKQPKS